MPRKITIDIQMQSVLWKSHHPELKPLIKKLLLSVLDAISQINSYGKNPLEVSILLTDDKNMQQLNTQYRNKESPTNVLAFPLYSADDFNNLPSTLPFLALGDIVLSYEIINREAQQQNKPFMSHLTHLILHGLLHLFGYDHQTSIETKQMENLEIKILSLFAIPNPYEI
jgi:probable rRNA maturation factor